METINTLLDEAKNAANLDSDNKLAIAMKVTRTTISYYRHGKSAPDIYVMNRLAEMTGRKLEEVVAIIKIQTEPDGARKEYWKRFYKSLGGIAAAFVIASISLPQAANYTSMYIMLNGLSRRKDRSRRTGRRLSDSFNCRGIAAATPA